MSSGAKRITRATRKRLEARERILAVAAKRFAEHGLGDVRLDEIADAADVARGTLYSHFRTKEELLTAMLTPVMTDAAEGIRRVQQLPGRRALDALLDLYNQLWRDHADALRVSQQAMREPLGGLSALHGEFVGGVLKVFDKLRSRGLLRTGDPAMSGRVLAVIAVPLLERFASHPDPARLFSESVRGLLIGDEAGETHLHVAPPPGASLRTRRRRSR